MGFQRWPTTGVSACCPAIRPACPARSLSWMSTSCSTSRGTKPRTRALPNDSCAEDTICSTRRAGTWGNRTTSRSISREMALASSSSVMTRAERSGREESNGEKWGVDECSDSWFSSASGGPRCRHHVRDMSRGVGQLLRTVGRGGLRACPACHRGGLRDGRVVGSLRARRRRRHRPLQRSGVCVGLPVAWSDSFLRVGLDRGQHSLGRDTSAGDQLAAGVTHPGAERRSPPVLPDQHYR